ncbi:amidohydrolase family protein [Sphingomicrobium sediminis]|uniref:Amidohydrolase family protein n=1 Tax=Sphingomicrobium sediminis TaxID=2950949 RepID=A0A9X2J221_9SPHN|nr:amidohydrolase family protein [Sphingomicrobium sediminis]MCM8556585.1 amidohydrolase family protein [Sphingomicrobium sediminis]
MKRLLTALAASLIAASPAAAQPVAITGGKLVIGDGSAPIDNGVVIVDDGRVVAAGNVAIPQGAIIVDASGKWVTPGIVAGYSRIGLAEVDGGSGPTDVSAGNSPHSAAIDVAWGVNPSAEPIRVSRADGVTRALVAPGGTNSIFAGQGAVIDTGMDYDPVTRAGAFQYVYMGQGGAQLAGGSRSAAALQLIDALTQARDGRPSTDRPEEGALTDADIRALRPVVRGEVPMLVAVERASDIVNLIRIKRQFPRIDMVLLGAGEGWLVADQIAAAGISVIAEPTANRPASFDQLAATQSNIGRLRAAGVDVGVALISDFVNRNARNGRQLAGNLVALQKVPGHTGVSWDQAFAMISSVPADMMGLGGEIGSLRSGRRADVVIWNGDPLELMSVPERVWIDGVEQDLTTRASRLAERYREIGEGQFPEAYDR